MKPLSIIIITYNRPDDTLFLLNNIAGLRDAAALLESVIIVNNASSADYSEVTNFIATHPQIPFNYVDAPENLGVARGRNLAISMAHAPIVITLDDDAFFRDEDALIRIMEAFEADYGQDRPVGILSFKVLYASTKMIQQNAFPHKQFEAYKDKDKFLASYFIGCGHAIKKEVYDKVGTYPADFFYGMEEYDLCYRTLNEGYAIVYNSSVVIYHNESPLGRTPHADKMRMLWVNKAKVAYRYLPLQYFGSTSLMWSLEYLKKTKWDFKGWFRGWKMVLNIPSSEKGIKLGTRTRDYLKKTKARLWF
ncbi:glycosyltransferase [Chitinophaga horti]|uniref:Glycosyltransferase n=1 Tax=Chitinophaga horti TaxID=2920382 RepID=A0ABY6JC66_9BACT|nr:glycosyltransferase [Chitinophaga horti]UYQ95894.1 glycosyltransferase [Chitinophaga horti]